MGRGGGGSGWSGVRVDVNDELKCFFFGGGGVGCRVGGDRVDVNDELKFFMKIQKKKWGGGGGLRGWGRVELGGLGWM